MFDFDVGKLLLIGVVALIFIPPKDLPEALRTLGRLISQARRMAADFQGQFSEALREAELADLKEQFSDLKNKTSVEGAFDRVASMLETPAKGPAKDAGDAVGDVTAPAAPPPESAAAESFPETFSLGPAPHDDDAPAAAEKTQHVAPGAPGSGA